MASQVTVRVWEGVNRDKELVLVKNVVIIFSLHTNFPSLDLVFKKLKKNVT